MRGSRANSRFTTSGKRKSIRGGAQQGVLWKTVSLATPWAARAGTACTAEAPVPTTPTLSPRGSKSFLQSAVWNDWPWNDSIPGKSGIFGTWSAPEPAMMTLASSSWPDSVLTLHWFISESQLFCRTFSLNLIWPSNPNLKLRKVSNISIQLCRADLTWPPCDEDSPRSRPGGCSSGTRRGSGRRRSCRGGWGCHRHTQGRCYPTTCPPAPQISPGWWTWIIPQFPGDSALPVSPALTWCRDSLVSCRHRCLRPRLR